MYPELTIHLFGTTITLLSYSVMSFLGALLGVLLALPALKKAGLRSGEKAVLLAAMAVFFLIGARLFNFIVNSDAYGTGLSLTSLRFVGFSLYGGVLGALAEVLMWGLFKKKSVWPVLDALFLPAAAAFVMARIGCFLNGCCAGKATDSVFGVVFPSNQKNQDLLASVFTVFSVKDVAVYPTQLFEAVLALVGLIPAFLVNRRRKFSAGTSFFVYGIWFTAMRWAILPLRSLPYSDGITRIFYPALYGFLILVGAFILWRINRKPAVNTEKQNKL